ncbi:MAG TPA: hypothetical protein VGW38_18195 [Chloroflexota bacterium]|nr:hypothetical protein [Chloroflexota bacterium]
MFVRKRRALGGWREIRTFAIKADSSLVRLKVDGVFGEKEAEQEKGPQAVLSALLHWVSVDDCPAQRAKEETQQVALSGVRAEAAR